jgi:hypothetical protein
MVEIIHGSREIDFTRLSDYPSFRRVGLGGLQAAAAAIMLEDFLQDEPDVRPARSIGLPCRSGAGSFTIHPLPAGSARRGISPEDHPNF